MLLFFDFDGTIADSLDTALIVLNEIAPEFGLPFFTKEEVLAYRGNSITEIITLTGLKYWQIPTFLMKARNALHSYMNQVEPFAEMREVLQQLIENEHELVILTSNSEKNVRLFLERHNLDMFKEIYAPNLLFGKAAVIKKVRNRKQYLETECWMIGDEERDILAAHKAGVNAAAVTWGFNDRKILEKANPTKMLDSPQELLTIFG